MYDDQWARDFARKLEGALGAPGRARQSADDWGLAEITRAVGELERKRQERWERDRESREAAQRAWEEANRRRDAQAGPQRARVAARAILGPPERLWIW